MAIPEETTAWLTVTFKDRKGNKQEPSTVEYRIDTVLGTQITSASQGTGSTPWVDTNSTASVQEITLVPDYNRIRENTSRGFQENIVTIKATFGLNDQRIEEFRYNIEDLKNI